MCGRGVTEIWIYNGNPRTFENDVTCVMTSEVWKCMVFFSVPVMWAMCLQIFDDDETSLNQTEGSNREYSIAEF